MAMIIDAIARHGVQEAIRSLLSPKNTTSDHAENSTPRYACARKIYESGRKGRICVYRISDERTNRDGCKVRLYTNVEGVNLDEDERQSFNGIKCTRNYNWGHSIRHKKGRTPPTADAVIKSKVEFKRLDVKPYDLGDKGSDRRSKSDDTAPSQAKGLSSTSNQESVIPRPVYDRKHSRFQPRIDPHGGAGVVQRRCSPSRALRWQKASCFGDRTLQETSVQEELVTYCSGALLIPQNQPDRQSMESAPTDPSRRPRETTIDSTIKLVNDVRGDPSGVVEHHQIHGKQNRSVVPEAPGSPFRQPGLTPQESSDLVFGTGSKVGWRRKLQAGRIAGHIAPDVHEFASQIVRDDPLGEAEQKTEACSPSPMPYAPGLENTPFGVRRVEPPLESQAHVPVGPSRTVASTWISRMNLSTSASALPRGRQNRPQKSESPADRLHGATEAKVSQIFPQQPPEQVSPGIPGLVYAQAGASSDRFLSTAVPGTPPYTPEKGELSKK